MTAKPPPPRFPVKFVVALFVAAVVIGGLIAYFGVTGHLGTAIP
jgi:hypothetical protein